MNFDYQKYAPLSGAAKRRILRFDQERGYGVGGIEPNRNRFYIYLTQRGSDVQVRTIAVKAKRRNQEPMLKQVILASVDETWMQVKDIAHYYIAGYSVDWTPEGMRGTKFGYTQWESECYDYRCMWKPWAPIVNPELLLRTRRFKYCCWDGTQDKILDYLKTYTKHPEIELLVKSGLGHYATRISVVRRLKKNKEFRQFFMQHAKVIKQRKLNVDVINKAFSMKISFFKAALEIDRRRSFKWVNLPRNINATKAYEYAYDHDLTHGSYTTYLQNCRKLGLDLKDTKVSFPKRFTQREKIVQEEVDVLRRLENKKRYEEMNRKLSAIADQWVGLTRTRGKFSIIIPRNVDEFIDEGKAMGNCLNERYAANVADGSKLIVFVRRTKNKKKTFVAAEYDIESGKITQCYQAPKNKKPEKEVVEFIEQKFKRVARKSQKLAA